MLKKPPSVLTKFCINVSLVVGLVTLSFAGDPQKMVATDPDGVAIKGYDITSK